MDKNEIEKALEDIHFIKEIITQNIQLFKNFIRSEGIRYLSLIFGILFLIVFSILYYFIEYNYIKINSIIINYIISGLIIISFILGGYFKWLIWNKLFPDKPWPTMFFKLIGIQIMKIASSILLLIITLTIILSILKFYNYILIVWGLGIGLLYTIYGCFSYLPELEITGYWMLFSTAISIIFIKSNNSNVFLWTAIIFGIAFIIIYAISTIILIKNKQKS